MRRLISALKYLDLHRVSGSPLMAAACRPWPQVLPQERPLRRDHQGTRPSPPSSLFSHHTLTFLSLPVASPLPQTLTLRASASASLPACLPPVQSFGVYAGGLVVRPLGGLIFGAIGDRYGSGTALQVAILAMALPTTLIGM